MLTDEGQSKLLWMVVLGMESKMNQIFYIEVVLKHNNIKHLNWHAIEILKVVIKLQFLIKRKQVCHLNNSEMFYVELHDHENRHVNNKCISLKCSRTC